MDAFRTLLPLANICPGCGTYVEEDWVSDWIVTMKDRSTRFACGQECAQRVATR